jgi:hypothetical protein
MTAIVSCSATAIASARDSPLQTGRNMSESGDWMREHLVMRANCAKCGGGVTFTCEPQPAWKPGDSDTGITGAAQATMRFAVWPCRKCYGEAAKPLAMMREALAACAPTPSETPK